MTFNKCLSQHPLQAGHILTMSTCNCLVVIWEITSEFSLTPSSRIYPYIITLPTGVICIASSTTAIISLKRSKHNFLWSTDTWINRKGAKYVKSIYSINASYRFLGMASSLCFIHTWQQNEYQSSLYTLFGIHQQQHVLAVKAICRLNMKS
jgi:hypothetical protein